MKCLNPLTLNHQGETFHVDCRKCNFCLQNRRNEWAFRLAVQLKHSHSAWVFTLTYDNEHLPTERLGNGNFEYMVLQKQQLITFCKSLRMFQRRTIRKIAKRYKWEKSKTDTELTKWQIKYYGVGEYGTLYQRPHYHIIMFNLHGETIRKSKQHDLWNRGGVYMDNVDIAAITYVAKYLIDKEQDVNDPRPKTFSIISKGLGIQYVKTHKTYHNKTRKTYASLLGTKWRIPRYLKEKLFTSRITRQALAKKCKDEVNEKIEKRIAQLESEFKSLPRALDYFDDALLIQYEQIRIKSKKQNRL